MVKLSVEQGLPFCSLEITYRGITIEDNDIIESISGIGGSEFVYKKRIDNIKLGNLEVIDFTIEVGVMDYGFDINGIIGMDFMRKVGSIIDLNKMIIYNSEALTT